MPWFYTVDDIKKNLMECVNKEVNVHDEFFWVKGELRFECDGPFEGFVIGDNNCEFQIINVTAMYRDLQDVNSVFHSNSYEYISISLGERSDS